MNESLNFSAGSWILIHHACVLKHVSPLATGASVAVLQVLSEVIGSIKLLGRVAFAELVHFLKMSNALIPVLVRGMLWHHAAGQGA